METNNKNDLKNKNYLDMPQSELYELARQKGIPGKSAMNKEELIHALETYEKATDPHSDLHRMDMYELHEIAKEKGVEHLWDMRKEELIEHIRYKEKMNG
jgi:transcription termination factor Rho